MPAVTTADRLTTPGQPALWVCRAYSASPRRAGFQLWRVATTFGGNYFGRQRAMSPIASDNRVTETFRWEPCGLRSRLRELADTQKRVLRGAG